jgi:hypothetical protein
MIEKLPIFFKVEIQTLSPRSILVHVFPIPLSDTVDYQLIRLKWKEQNSDVEEHADFNVNQLIAENGKAEKLIEDLIIGSRYFITPTAVKDGVEDIRNEPREILLGIILS